MTNTPSCNNIILLVEDNEDDVFLMRRALKTARIINPLCVAEDGEQAIDYLAGQGQFSDRTLHPSPRIVFLDLKLPKKSGFDVLNWMQESREKMPPVVVLSSSNSPDDWERVTALGAVICAVKPPNSALFEQVAELLNLKWETAP